MNSASFSTLGLSWSATFRGCMLAASASPSAAALPGGVQDLGDGSLQALMGIRDNQLDATKTAPGELAQEVGPEDLGLRGADRQAQHLAPAVAIDADRDNHRDRDDATVAARLHVGGI